jgi:hypothetical protein
MKTSIASPADFAALDPFFRIIERGLDSLAGPGHFFDLLAEDAVFEYVITVPGYPRRIEGRATVAELYRPYGQALAWTAATTWLCTTTQPRARSSWSTPPRARSWPPAPPTATATSPSSPSATTRSSTGGTTSTRSPSLTHSAGRLAELVKHRPVQPSSFHHLRPAQSRQVTHATERLSHCVIIAGCGCRARSALPASAGDRKRVLRCSSRALKCELRGAGCGGDSAECAGI